ncbi:hypothetical protein [Maribacter sp. 2307ULW6-5]|uniref:hypothetical protein n=1 Tax=Maribacter sp. 2307ULW6-5 TaxID=3386275 RepID=UPI0039BD43D0
MSIAFIFGVLFFAAIYFFDKSKHEKMVEVSMLKKQVQKQNLDKIEEKEATYKRQVNNFKNSVSYDLVGFVWDKTSHKNYPRYINGIPTGYDYTEISTKGRFDDGKAVISILLIEEYPNLNIHYSVSAFEKHKQTGHSHEILRLHSINEMNDIYLTFLKMAMKNNKEANLQHNLFAIDRTV